MLLYWSFFCEQESGDRLLLDYSGSVDGVKFDGGTAEDQALVLGSGSFIPGFEDQLIGTHAGEQKDITVTFPAEYHATELAGKEAVFACNVKAVQVKELPEIDDDFIADISEFDTVAEWKADKKEKMIEEKRRAAANARENAALKRACDNAAVEIPDVIIDRETDRMVRDLEYRLSGSGLDMNTYCQYLGTTVEEMKKNFRPDAAERVKMQLLIDAVIKAEALTVTDEEIDAEIDRYAEANGMVSEDLKPRLTEDDRNYFKERATVDKAVRLIADSAVLGGPIDDDVANLVIAQMLFLEAEDPDKDIFLYINSPGGSVSAGLAIYDTMQYIRCECQTICVGLAASMGAFLLAAGAKGKRRALENAEIMIHQPSGGAQGQATEIRIHAEQILKIRDRLNKVLAARTGQPLSVIEADTERDNFMDVEHALSYGLIDEIIQPRR